MCFDGPSCSHNAWMELNAQNTSARTHTHMPVYKHSSTSKSMKRLKHTNATRVRDAHTFPTWFYMCIHIHTIPTNTHSRDPNLQQNTLHKLLNNLHLTPLHSCSNVQYARNSLTEPQQRFPHHCFLWGFTFKIYIYTNTLYSIFCMDMSSKEKGQTKWLMQW